jgi:MFS family permease
MRTFTLIWFGQMVSMLGSKMTAFALLTWAYQQTGQATTLALLGFFSFLPYVLVSPLAGVWVDRFDRRKVMMLADTAAGLTTVFLFVMFVTGQLQIWHIYLAELLGSACGAFHFPAYNASVTLLAPKSQHARANGMRSLGQYLAEVGAPFLAGMVLALAGIGVVMLFDLVTFVFAVSTLLLVHIPQPEVSAEGRAARGSTRQEMAFGFRYIWARKGLLGLLLIFTGINLFAALTYYGVLPSMILGRTGGDEMALASVQGAMGLGGVLGGLVVSVWGLPKRRIHAVLSGTAASFLLGDLLFATGRTLPVWILAGLLGSFFIPILVSGERAIWQAKVPPDVQGRVFAVNGMIRTAMMPLGYVLGGVLADYVFEPALAVGGSLAGTFGWLVGTGPGAGIALMFFGTMFMGTTLCLGSYLIRAVRCVEDDLPDYDAAPESLSLPAELAPVGAD